MHVQKRHGLYIDPANNWFTQNVKRFGAGFDMKKLTEQPGVLSAKFDRLSTKYDQWTVGNKSRVEHWLAHTARAAAPELRSPDVRILDVACGIGLPAHMLRLSGFRGHITGTDISPGMCEQAQARGCYDHVFVADVNIDGLANIATGSMDLVVCTGAMELLDHVRVLGEFARVLHPGGSLWVSFQWEGVQDEATAEELPCPTVHQNVRGVRVEDALYKLAEAGFSVCKDHGIEKCREAFHTPSPAQDGSLLPVPYIFFVAVRQNEWQPTWQGA